MCKMRLQKQTPLKLGRSNLADLAKGLEVRNRCAAFFHFSFQSKVD